MIDAMDTSMLHSLYHEHNSSNLLYVFRKHSVDVKVQILSTSYYSFKHQDLAYYHDPCADGIDTMINCI